MKHPCFANRGKCTANSNRQSEMCRTHFYSFENIKTVQCAIQLNIIATAIQKLLQYTLTAPRFSRASSYLRIKSVKYNFVPRHGNWSKRCNSARGTKLFYAHGIHIFFSTAFMKISKRWMKSK